MRTFEILFVSLLAVSGFLTLLSGARFRAILYMLLGISLTALLLHLVLEGAHWQMAPAYLAALVFAAQMILIDQARSMPRVGGWAVVLLVVLTCGFSFALPMFRLPQPTGTFPIGTQTMMLVDHGRSEQTEGSGGRNRELMIQIWYPADLSRNPFAPYRRPRETTFVSSYQSVLWTHARIAAPVARGAESFPVLLFNPSWNGRRTQNTYLVEDLVSHGYVVAAIDHTYNSGPVAFPDGRVVQFIPVRDMQDFSSTTLDRVESIAADELKRQADDNVFVLDQLQAMNADLKSPFYGRLQTSNAGAFGHSFGGAVSAQVCSIDPRIRAALDLDGSLFGEVQREGLRKPFMFIQEDVTHPTPAELAHSDMRTRIDAALNDNDTAMARKSEAFRIFLHGSTHSSFTDYALFSPFKALSDTGRIPARRQFFIIRQFALAFFDQILKGKSSSMLDSRQSPFSEASFDTTILDRSDRD